MSQAITNFASLDDLAAHLRNDGALAQKKYILMFAYNGTGKTRSGHAASDLFRGVTKMVRNSNNWSMAL